MRRRLVFLLGIGLLMTAPFSQAQNWQWQNPLPTGNSLSDVVFVNENTGWIVGGSGTILHTTDGGATWTFQESGTGSGLAEICFRDSQQGFAVGGESG
ncbi:MAG: YCF48-related protein [bacterium]|nr:YCF48-related protein [bacterium]